MLHIFNCPPCVIFTFLLQNSFCWHLDKLATLNEFSCIKVKERSARSPRAECFHLNWRELKVWPSSSSSSSSFPSPVIKLSFTSRKMSVVKNCAYFSLILLTFHHGKINISKSKNNWQNKKEISIKIFFTISVWKLLLWFKHWPISLYFVFPALSESELSLTGCTGECFPFCPVIPFISAAILNCYSLARITPSTPLKPLEAF